MAALCEPAVEERAVVETARRGRLAEFAYEYTKRMLFDGTLVPGAKLRVEDIVATLQTSRQPVMDAFKRLASEGYIEITPQVGCRVVTPDAAEIADFFLILGAVHGLAAEIAAGRRTADELKLLGRIADELEALRALPPSLECARAYHRLDHDFARLTRTMAHSEAVAHIAAGLLDRRDFYIACIGEGELLYAARLRDAHGEHRAVATAIADGNAERARTRLEALVVRVGRFASPAAAPA